MGGDVTSSSGARWGRRGVAAEPVVARYIGSGGELRAGGFVFSEVFGGGLDVGFV